MGIVCPVCDGASLLPVATLPSVPATIGDCYATRDLALDAPVGRIELVVCEACGLIRNIAFDDELLSYSPGYENSQMFSPTFREYAETLAAELIEEYSLRDGRVVEIGCGKGEFLRVLAAHGVGDAIGYDVSYDGEVDDAEGITIVRELYGAGPVPSADLLATRHVVEHLVDPREVLTSLRDAVGDDLTPIYVEVPDASFVLTERGMWDVIYPHVNYFAEPTMRTLLERSGWDPTRVHTAFSGQFLSAHARPSDRTDALPRDAEVAALLDAVADFSDRLTGAAARWPEELTTRRSHGPIALWGAGSKGVSILCLPGVGEQVDAVVDVNVRKHGTYVPAVGHRVDGPEALVDLDPATVLITNPVYEDEIRTEIRRLGMSPELVLV